MVEKGGGFHKRRILLNEDGDLRRRKRAKVVQTHDPSTGKKRATMKMKDVKTESMIDLESKLNPEKSQGLEKDVHGKERQPEGTGARKSDMDDIELNLQACLCGKAEC